MADKLREQVWTDYLKRCSDPTLGHPAFNAGYDAAIARTAELVKYPHNKLMAARKAQREAEALVVALRDALNETHSRWRPNAECGACRALAAAAGAAEAIRKHIEREAVKACLQGCKEKATGLYADTRNHNLMVAVEAELAAPEANRG